MTGWCGGAPGHGLARLGLLNGLAKNHCLSQGIEWALAAARRVTFPGPQNLCCGEPGRMWLFASAGCVLQRADLLEEARLAARNLIQSRRDQGAWHLRPVTERETLPTLMGGIAGIGLALLAVRQPNLVSPVLVLG